MPTLMLTELLPGAQTICPICNGRCYPAGDRSGLPRRLRDMKVFSPGRIPLNPCPTCGATDDERLIYLYLLHRTRAFEPTAPPLTILHMEPEPRLYETLQRVSRVSVRSEPSSQLPSLEVDDRSVDIVLCNDILDRVRDEAAALRSIRRVLKTDGLALVQSAVSSTLPATHEDAQLTTDTERSKAFGSALRVRLYGADYAQRLASAGFTVERFRWWRGGRRFGGALRNRYALVRGEVLYVIRPSTGHSPSGHSPSGRIGGEKLSPVP